MNIYYRTPMPIGDQLQVLKDLPIVPLSDSTLSSEWSAVCVIPQVWYWDANPDEAGDGIPRFSGSSFNGKNSYTMGYVTLPFDLFLELCHLAVITNYFLAVEMLKDRLSAFH